MSETNAIIPAPLEVLNFEMYLGGEWSWTRLDKLVLHMSKSLSQSKLKLYSVVANYNNMLSTLTGSGKTYTMMGPDSNPGVNIRAIQELLKVCDERVNVDYTMKVSMVEVYNETLRDLLCDSKTSKQLTIQMKGKQLIVTDVTEEQVLNENDIKTIMKKGEWLYSYTCSTIFYLCPTLANQCSL